MAQASAKKLEHTGSAEKERVATVPQKAIGKYAKIAFAKRERNRTVCSEHQEEKRRDVRLVGAAVTSKELAGWCMLQRKNLNILGLLKRKG